MSNFEIVGQYLNFNREKLTADDSVETARAVVRIEPPVELGPIALDYIGEVSTAECRHFASTNECSIYIIEKPVGPTRPSGVDADIIRETIIDGVSALNNVLDSLNENSFERMAEIADGSDS